MARVRDGLSVEVDDRELRRALADLRETVDEATLTDTLLGAVEPMREAAAQKAPVRTGHLKHSIVAEVAERRHREGEATVGVYAAPGTGLGSQRSFYAHMQEFGTRHHAAQPFMRPAFDERRRQVVEAARRGLRDVIIREVGE